MGGTVINPRTRIPGSAAMAYSSSSSRSGATPVFCSSPPMLTSTSTSVYPTGRILVLSSRRRPAKWPPPAGGCLPTRSSPPGPRSGGPCWSADGRSDGHRPRQGAARPFSEEFLHPVFPDMGHPCPDSGVDPRGRHRFCHGQQGDVLPFSSRRGAGSGRSAPRSGRDCPAQNGCLRPPGGQRMIFPSYRSLPPTTMLSYSLRYPLSSVCSQMEYRSCSLWYKTLIRLKDRAFPTRTYTPDSCLSLNCIASSAPGGLHTP